MLMENADMEEELKSAIMKFCILCVPMNGLKMMLLLFAKDVATDSLITVCTLGRTPTSKRAYLLWLATIFFLSYQQVLWLLQIMNLVCQKNLPFIRRQCAMEMSLACLTVLDFILSMSLETSAKVEITRLEFGALKV